MTKVPGDAAARRELLDDLDSTFVVEAAAGTGKTTVLVSRIVRVVATGHGALSKLIAVTFTEKAAGELKLRLRDALETARREHPGGPEGLRLVTALEELEVARIGTIHGLCADFLREYPVEAGVDPRFEVAAQGDSDALLGQVFDRQFQELLRHPPEGIRRVLRRRSRGREELPRRLLALATTALVEHRDFPAPWRRDPFDRDARLDAVIARLEPLAELSKKLTVRRASSWFAETVHEVRRLCDDLRHREAVAPRDHDGLEAQLGELVGYSRRWTDQAYGVRFDGVTEAEALAIRDHAWVELSRFLRDADADVAACLKSELQPVVAAYETEKARRGVLDFVDLLLKTRDLVRGHRAVRAELQARFTHLFLDEFQDTDPLQSELVLLLAADDPREDDATRARCVPGKLFVVGDPKQSIYRFRRADVALYERVKEHLIRDGARLQYLSTSFRSTPGIQAAVNASFERAMGPGASAQASYVPLGPWRERHEGQPSLIALPAPFPFSAKGWPSKDAVESSLPQAVAAFVDWLVRHSGWTVEGEAGEVGEAGETGARIPIETRHVCILFKRLRRFGGVDVPRPYAQALEARRLQHVLVGGRSFHAREEVLALRTALWAIERPDDELSVFATLKGPLFALSDEALLVFRAVAGRLNPLVPREAELADPRVAEVALALEVLGKLHRRRNRRPAASTVHELLEATRAHAGVALWSGGQQALANVLQLAEVASRHEQRSTSFRDVIEALEEEAESGEASEAPIVEEGTEGVRMMTVHAAKGLEFPVVILAEPTAGATRAEPSHWVDPAAGLWVHALAGCIPAQLREHEEEVRARDREEAVRVTYVAATRARDLLVVPVCSEKRFDDTWTSVLEPALWPAEESLEAPRPAPGCPAFGADVIVDRQGSPPPSVPRPGLHLATSRKNGVVWFNPSKLELSRESPGGLEASEALEDEPAVAAQAMADHLAWRQDREVAVREGQQPSRVVRVARELEVPKSPGGIPVEETQVVRVGRPRGRRFGELVHAALAHVPLDADRSAIDGVVAVHARALLAPPEEVRAAGDAVEAALAHPLLAAARVAREVRREAPVLDVGPGGEVTEGVIDLAFADEGGWTVIEFKTDDDLEGHRPAYEAQAEAYVRAIAGATATPTRGVLLRV
jgi:ATP-dependent exoDNAse (exonuclease V) beta subunit